MSRLLNSTNKTREQLEARNLYTPEDPYDANASNTVETINSIVNIVSPFSTFDLSNTIAGRLVGNNTPLAQIGLQMLARQFGRTAASNAAAEYLPAIKFSNLFDGDPNTKFISVKKDYQITRRATQSNIGKILEEISGNYPLKGNPFGQNSDNLDYIKNSGKGQLQLYVKSLNANKYKPSSINLQAELRKQKFNYGNIATVGFLNYFIGQDSVFTPYNQYKVSKGTNLYSINQALNNEIQQFRISTQNSDYYLEYGATQKYVDGLGLTSKVNNNNGSGDYNFENADDNYGLDDDNRAKLIWGRDGINNEYRSEVEGFDKQIDGVQPSDNGDFITKINPRWNNTNNVDAFNLDAGGLLSYTRQLLNSKGKYSSFDLTKKKFIGTDEQLHFNGSPLTKHVDGTIDRNRQHSIVDPYDNYVKAIRYNGNKIYNGNENSVIYKSVIPQVVPTVGGINKNLMFSIENLAVEVTGDKENDPIAFVVDDYKTELPICEMGPNNGRIMWFPPYDIQISENVVVNRTSTSFLGRGEPIYTYNNTERLANLSFKLIVDYPPQVRGLDHVKASRFFAFGGELEQPKSNLGDKIKQREDLIKQRDKIKPTKKMANPQINPQTINFYFANDEPKIGKATNNVDYNLTELYYEVSKTGVTNWQGPDGRNTLLNENFAKNMDQIIIDMLSDDKKIDFIQIDIDATASTLFNAANGADYNKLLSDRRAEAIKSYIKSRYNVLTDKQLKDNYKKNLFNLNGIGQVGGEATDSAAEIPTDEAKQARSAVAQFRYNDLEEEVGVPISEKEREDLIVLNEQITALDTEISRIKNKSANIGDCDFTPYTIQDGILKGFKSTQNNIYKPAFHSQTPEDFHRRLTFLHQCTRQGQAVRKKRGDDNTFSANNSVFGRQPVQILRIGDMFHTKIFIDNMQIDYSDAPWDMNPEGMGMQFMIADVKLQLKLVGGQSLKGPISILQNAVSYNFYANSTFYNDGVYKTATIMEDLQYSTKDEENPSNSVKATIEESAANKKTNSNPTTT